MAGADSNSIQDAFIEETVVDTTPATPAFTLSSFDNIQMQGNPRLSEVFPRSSRGERSGIGKNGFSVTGSASGALFYGEYDSWFESLFQGTWAGDVLVNGKAQETLSFEQGIPLGAGGALAYARFRGVEAVTGSLNIVAGDNVQVNFDLIGQSREAMATGIIAGATYVAPAVTDVISSGAEIGTITMAGFTLDCIANINIDWGVVGKTEQPQVGSDDACGINRGTFRPRITGQFYAEANLINLFEGAAATADFALVIPLGSVTGEKYSINFPLCQFASSPIAAEGEGPVFVDFEILAQYDAAGIDGTCEITRAIA